MKSRTNQPIYNDNGKLAQDMPNTSASDSGKVLGIDASGKVVPVSSGTKLYRHEIEIKDTENNTYNYDLISFDKNPYTKTNGLSLQLGVNLVSGLETQGNSCLVLYFGWANSGNTDIYLFDVEDVESVSRNYDIDTITDTVIEL